VSGGTPTTADRGRTARPGRSSPFSTDLFFPPEDCEADCRALPNGHYRPIETPIGHFAMFCLRPEDQDAIDAVIGEMLAS